MEQKFWLILFSIVLFINACAPASETLSPTEKISETEKFAATSSMTADQRTEPVSTERPDPTDPVFSSAPYPLQIEEERKLSYPGSEITFEETLQTRPSYDQFIVSYLSEGYKIYAYMAIPKWNKPETGWPAIILNHGYHAPSTYVTTENYISFMDVLSRNGYIVFKPDYRAHGNSEGKVPLGGGYGSPDYTTDVLNALASIKRFQDADPDRIGMVGHSMGGAITLRAMVVSREIKAASIWSGVVGSYVDLAYRWHHDLINPSDLTQTLSETPQPTPTIDFNATVRGWASVIVSRYGNPAQNPEFWDSISPTSFLEDISGPLELQVSKTDSQVSWAWSQTLAEDLQEIDKQVDLYIYEEDDHNLTNNYLTAISRTLAFFNKYVKNN